MKADTTGDGKVSLEEFMAICTEYGIQLSEEGEQELATVFGIYGEVNIKDIYTQRTVFMYLQMSKGDFISHIKKNNLARHFEVVKFKAFLFLLFNLHLSKRSHLN